MRTLITIAIVGALGALVIVHPVHAPTTSPRGWETVAPVPAAHPRASVAPARVYVAGEVAHPGVYSVGVDDRVADAVARAGGLRPSADPTAVNLAAHVRDGDEILVVARGAATAHRGPRRPHAQRGGRGHGKRHRHTNDDAVQQVDLNHVDAATLATVPGIGVGLAERIVAFRSANGPFSSPDELLDVSGITDRRLDALLPYLVAR